MEWVKEIARTSDWQVAYPWVKVLLAMQIIDIFMGVLSSIRKKNLNSTVGWKGFTRKAGTLGIVTMVGIIDPLMPVQLTVGAAMAYCGWEALSVLEKAGKLGIPIPSIILETLEKLREVPNKVQEVRIVESTNPIPMKLEIPDQQEKANETKPN